MPNLPNVREDVDRKSGPPARKPPPSDIITDDYWKKASNVRKYDWWDTDHIGYESMGALHTFTNANAKAYQAGKLSEKDRKTYEMALLRLKHQEQVEALHAQQRQQDLAARQAAERQQAFQAARQQVNQAMHPYLPPQTIGNRFRDPNALEQVGDAHRQVFADVARRLVPGAF